MSETLKVAPREQTGKLVNRRLRQSGQLPAVLYGHGKPSVSLSLSEDQFRATLRHGAKVVELTGAESGQALLQHVQWDTFQQSVLHVDLLRLEKGELVTVEVPLQVRGEAPGEHHGGVVELLVRSVEIEVSPAGVPEALHLNVNHLELNETLPLSAIEDLPAGARILGDSAQVAVQCVEPVAAPTEEGSGAAIGGEPELIGRHGDDESEAG
jgi:large subunit ribosomal protein L25